VHENIKNFSQYRFVPSYPSTSSSPGSKRMALSLSGSSSHRSGSDKERIKTGLRIKKIIGAAPSSDDTADTRSTGEFNNAFSSSASSAGRLDAVENVLRFAGLGSNLSNAGFPVTRPYFSWPAYPSNFLIPAQHQQ
jgi:hypothetical protein